MAFLRSNLLCATIPTRFTGWLLPPEGLASSTRPTSTRYVKPCPSSVRTKKVRHPFFDPASLGCKKHPATAREYCSPKKRSKSSSEASEPPGPSTPPEPDQRAK